MNDGCKGKVPKTLSVVVPCYNSQHTIAEVTDGLITALKESDRVSDFEIVLIDDGSVDDTGNLIQRLGNETDCIKPRSLTRNFGQQAAIMAGFSLCSGEVVACLDDDGQTPPEEIVKLLAKLDEGYDVVYGVFSDKKHNSKFRDLGSKLNKWAFSTATGKPDRFEIASYFVARKYIIDEVRKYTKPFPNVNGQIVKCTHNIGNVVVEHRARKSGRSGYNFSKLFNLWMDGLISYSLKPLRVLWLVSVFLLLASVCVFAASFVAKSPTTCLVAFQLLASGLISFLLALLAEYCGRTYIDQNAVPQFLISQVEREYDGNE